jgi:hypothetical protein
MEANTQLRVGQRLLVELDDEGVWTGQWVEMAITDITVCHHYSPEDAPLEPYVCVGVDHRSLRCFNYTYYCAGRHVKFAAPVNTNAG